MQRHDRSSRIGEPLFEVRDLGRDPVVVLVGGIGRSWRRVASGERFGRRSELCTGVVAFAAGSVDVGFEMRDALAELGGCGVLVVARGLELGLRVRQLVLQPQRASRGRGTQERLGGGTQAQERQLGSRAWANAARGPPIRIGQVAEGHLAGTDRIMADHLGTAVADDHLLFVGHHLDALADQRFGHQVARGPEANTAALIDRAGFDRTQRWTSRPTNSRICRSRR